MNFATICDTKEVWIPCKKAFFSDVNEPEFFFWITDWQAKYHTISSARNERLSRDNRRYKGQQKFEDFKSLLFLKLISALILA